MIIRSVRHPAARGRQAATAPAAGPDAGRHQAAGLQRAHRLAEEAVRGDDGTRLLVRVARAGAVPLQRVLAARLGGRVLDGIQAAAAHTPALIDRQLMFCLARLAAAPARHLFSGILGVLEYIKRARACRILPPDIAHDDRVGFIACAAGLQQVAHFGNQAALLVKLFQGLHPQLAFLAGALGFPVQGFAAQQVCIRDRALPL